MIPKPLIEVLSMQVSVNKRKTYIVLCILMSSSGIFADETLKWREEVRLQNGNILIIERAASFKENWVPGGGGGSFNEGMAIRSIEANGVPIIPHWDDKFVPIILDRDTQSKDWFIVATFFHCESWYALGKPALPYVEYRLRRGKWLRQPLSKELIGRDSNLFPADLSLRDSIKNSSSTLTFAKKRALYSRMVISPEFLRIVSHWPTSANC